MDLSPIGFGVAATIACSHPQTALASPAAPVITTTENPETREGMKESYIEDPASHGGPDHALATREGAAKRWIGVHAGRDMEPRNGSCPGCRRAHARRKATPPVALFASGRRVPRGRRTRARVRSLHAENREVSWSPVPVADAPSWMVWGVAGRRATGREGKAKAVIPR